MKHSFLHILAFYALGVVVWPAMLILPAIAFNLQGGFPPLPWL